MGFMISSWPKVLGSDVAGEVHSVGANVTRFKPGDRAAGIAQGLLKGTAEEGAFAHYTKLPAKTAAKIPDAVSFKDAAVLGMAIGTASCGLYGEQYLAQPFLNTTPQASGRVIVVYGASSSIGSMTVQLAAASGLRVIGICGSKNFDFVRQCGASETFDYTSSDVVSEVVNAVGKDEFAGIFNAISDADSYKLTLEILEKVGGGRMATSRPPPKELPEQIQATYMMGPGEHSAPVWESFVTEGLGSGKLKCLPEPMVVGKGLESFQDALDKAKAGVSAKKLVVEL